MHGYMATWLPGDESEWRYIFPGVRLAIWSGNVKLASHIKLSTDTLERFRPIPETGQPFIRG